MRMIRGAQTLTGILIGTMRHDAGHEFLRMGRLLERGDMTTRIVDVRSESLLPDEPTGLRPFENIQWISVLKSLNAFQMYRRHMQSRVRRTHALRFLLGDELLPRSVYRCAAEVDGSLAKLPRSDEPRRVAGRLMRSVRSADLAVLVENQRALHEFVDQLQIAFGQVNDAIAATYFEALATPTEG